MIRPNLPTAEQTKAPFIEELGVHYGNGSLFDDRRWDKTGFDIYGDLYDDQPYLEFYVSKLIEDVYSIKPRSYVHPRSATLILRTLSRKALSVKENVGLHPGRKIHLHLPGFLQGSKSAKACAPFIRGLVDIEGSLRFRKQFRDRHYYPVLECEMGDSPFIKSLHRMLLELGMPVAFRVRGSRAMESTHRTKASFYVSGWNGVNIWLARFGLANAKHLSKLLIAQKHGYCPPHTSLDERLAIIAGEIDPESFYGKRLGDAVAFPRYRYAHEVMILRIACRPQILRLFVDKMKVRAKLTKIAISNLATSHDLQLRQTEAGRVVETTGRGHERLGNLYGGWEQLKSKYGIIIPDSPSYCPAAFYQKSVN
jgi:hypothetical protein